MSIASIGAGRVNSLVDAYGSTIVLYQPSISYNKEGDDTIDLGSGTSTKSLMFHTAGEEMQYKVEGLDLANSYRCFFKGTETLNEKTIFYHGGKYYNVFSLHLENKSDTNIYYMVIITKSDINI